MIIGQKINSRAERILSMIADIRENPGKYNSRELAEKYNVHQQMVLRDLQLARKYGFVKHDIKLRKYIFLS